MHETVVLAAYPAAANCFLENNNILKGVPWGKGKTTPRPMANLGTYEHNITNWAAQRMASASFWSCQSVEAQDIVQRHHYTCHDGCREEHTE